MIRHRKFILIVLCLLIIAGPAAAIDRVTFTPLKKSKNGQTTKLAPQTLEGRTLVEDQSGGRVLQTADGRLWPIPSAWKPSCESDDRPFKPLSADELAKSLKKKLPPGFNVYKTKHYVVLYSTSRAYAKWSGSLLERLYMAFQNFWRRKKLDIKQPEFPLVAIIFGSRADYANYAVKELGIPKDQVGKVIGYYNIKTNLMVMYDVTGTSGAMTRHKRTTAQINQLLSQPGAATTTATIIHEATHQIAHNCGIHTRLADNPLWFVEGLALYFETPDLSSARGWRTIGSLNPTRMRDFVKYVRSGKRPANSIQTLIKDSKRIKDLSLATNGYAEAWAMTYFLIRQRPKEYVEYVKKICDKKPCQAETPEQQTKAFIDVFGDLNKLERDFMRYMSKQYR